MYRGSGVGATILALSVEKAGYCNIAQAFAISLPAPSSVVELPPIGRYSFFKIALCLWLYLSAVRLNTNSGVIAAAGILLNRVVHD